MGRSRAGGAEADAGWRQALGEVPRELFVPETIWIEDEEAGGYVTLSRPDNPDRWFELVAADEAVVIQVDDGRAAPGSVGRSPSSSCSKPSIVAEMLRAADVRAGQVVLEIGTGTGWNAALLSTRVGGRGRVVSIEIDAELARVARASLEHTGYPATVVAGDGEAGYPPAGPYDRVLSTVAVRWRVPRAWIDQTRPGGLVVTPWGTSFHNGTLLRLEVTDDGTAAGRFGGKLAFIRLRGQRGPGWVADEDLTDADSATTAMTSTEIGQAVDSFDGAFAVGLHLPDCRLHIDDHAVEGQPRVWLSDGQSLARVAVNIGSDSHQVHQRGPRRLWDEVEAAYQWWRQAGKPEHTRFGLTVTAGYQSVWLDDAANPIATTAEPATKIDS